MVVLEIVAELTKRGKVTRRDQGITEPVGSETRGGGENRPGEAGRSEKKGH